MNSMNGSDYLEMLPPRAIALTVGQVDQARQRSRAVTNPDQQWQTYLNQLSLFGFEQWLHRRASDVLTHPSDNSIMQLSGVPPVVCNIIVNDFKVCLIPVESQPDEVEIPAAIINSPEFAAHFYVTVAVYEEHSQIAVHSFLRHDQLTAQAQSLQPDADNLYSIPISTFEHDFDRLLLYLRCSEPSAIPLPTNSLTANSQQLIAQTINVRRWLQNELDELAQQLSWILLPPLAFREAMRITARVVNQPTPQESFENVIKQLVRDGMTLPVDARIAYRDLDVGQVAARLYAIAGTLSPDPTPEWTLLIILGPRSQTSLPRDTQLQISDSDTHLTQQTLTQQDNYLYAKVIGSLEEQFWVTITVPNCDAVTLPPFAFQTNS